MGFLTVENEKISNRLNPVHSFIKYTIIQVGFYVVIAKSCHHFTS